MVVDIRYQTLSCYEGNTGVYFTHISSGALYNYLGEKVMHGYAPSGDSHRRNWSRCTWWRGRREAVGECTPRSANGSSLDAASVPYDQVIHRRMPAAQL